jgi:hypothetical protein
MPLADPLAGDVRPRELTSRLIVTISCDPTLTGPAKLERSLEALRAPPAVIPRAHVA